MKHEVESALVSDDAEGAVYRFSQSLSVFKGHFPNHALVPGVFLIEAARTTAERRLGRPLRIAAVDNARFTAEVFPDVEVRCNVRLTEVSAGLQCDATVETAAGSVARLRLTLATD